MKYIFSLICFLLASIVLSAKDIYYYEGEHKIPLKEVKGKMVVITPKTEVSEAAFSLMAVPAIKTLHSDILSIKVVNTGLVNKAIKKKQFTVPVHTEGYYLDPQGMEVFPTGFINLKLKREDDYPILEKRVAEYNLTIVEQNNFMPLWYELVIDPTDPESVIDICNALHKTGDFECVSPAFWFDPFEISYDPDVDQQWGLFNYEYEGIDINVVQAWDYATGVGIKIAIVDNGVDVNHKDLKNNIHLSYDCHTQTAPTKTYGDHGTHCAGIASAARNNGIQIAGVAPDAKIMAAGIYLDGNNATKELADGINWAWQNGADIISCSWAVTQECKLISNAIDEAVTKGRDGKGCVFVKSAGNSNSEITYPGSYRKEVIAVGAIDPTGNRWIDTKGNASCFGENLLLCAPGEEILSTVPDNKIKKYDGTSTACPHVSGVAALILQRNPSLTALKVREILAKSVRQVGDKPYSTDKEFGKWNQWHGYGLIDAYQAVINTPRK